jgi:undecaprenyl-diphosphatase
MENKTKLILKILFFTLLTGISIGGEFLYREPLFNDSIIWIKQIQNNGNKASDTFFNIITKFGTLPIFLPIFIIVFLFSSLTSSYTLYTTFTITSFMTNIMKICYSSPRPYWVDISLLKDCSEGYGNPSGHASDSVAVYLTLWKIISEVSFIKKRVWAKYLILLFLTLLIATIMFSRIYLGVHSVNQILYGASLGFIIYYLFIELLDLLNCKPKDLFSLYRHKKFILIALIIHIAMLVLLILCYAFIHPDKSKYDQVLKDNCPKIDITDYNGKNFLSGLNIVIHYGSHYGLVFLSFMIDKYYRYKENEVNEWHSIGCDIKQQFYRVLICVGLSCVSILYFVFNIGNYEVIVVSFLGIFMPLFITLFNLFGLAIFICLKVGVVNPRVYESAETGILNI